MSLLKPVQATTACLKWGMLGEAGSGKTFTAVQIAIGLCKLTGKKKIAFFDTEKGSEFHKDRIEKAGLEFFSVRSRSFFDLIATVREAEKGEYGCLIIDSISHVWKELMDSYLKAKGRKFISIPDWGPLKGQWSEFTDLYVNTRLDIVLCGRAADTYEDFQNEDTGRMESRKVGVKMRTEKETSYEPDLLLLMERVTEGQRSKGKKKGSAWIHQVTVLKDRWDIINGETFDNPTFDTFLPVVNKLNLKGTHTGVDTTNKSIELFKDSDRSFEQRKIDHQIALEKLEEVLTLLGLVGTSAAAKKGQAEMLMKVFGTSSGTHIKEKLTTAQILEGVETIRAQGRLEMARELNEKKTEPKPSAEDERVAELVDKETMK